MKIRLHINFHEKLWKNDLNQFFRIFLTSQDKKEDEDEKHKKTIFEFAISKLDYVHVFMKV